MQNKKFKAIVALSATLTTNLLNPPAASGGVNAGSSAQVIYLRHVRILNKTDTPVSFTMYLGATGANVAGTEVIGYRKSVPAYDYIDWFGDLRIDAADFLVGGASVVTSLVATFEGEIGVAG